MKEKRKMDFDADKEFCSIPMDSHMKDSSGIISDMALEFSNSIQSKFTEDSGSLTNFQAKERSKTLLLLTKERVKSVNLL